MYNTNICINLTQTTDINNHDRLIRQVKERDPRGRTRGPYVEVLRAAAMNLKNIFDFSASGPFIRPT